MKVISVPISADAQNRLNVDSCLCDDLVEVELTDSAFHDLWVLGFFSDLNDTLGILIDDFEDEFISFEKINIAIDIIDFHLRNNKENNYLPKIKKLFQLAYDKKTGVYFFF